MIYILTILLIVVLGYLGWRVACRLSDYCDDHYENPDCARKHYGSKVLIIGLGCALVGFISFTISSKFFCLILFFIGLLAVSAGTFLKQKVWEDEGNLEYITGKKQFDPNNKQSKVSDLISSFLASFTISVPIALIFGLTNIILGLVAIIILPIALTIAYIKDQPLREKKEAKRLKLQTQLFLMQVLSNTGKSASSTPTIDTDRLRNDMMDYYGTAMHSGFPMAQADLTHIQGVSDAELIRKAQNNGFDLNKYTTWNAAEAARNISPDLFMSVMAVGKQQKAEGSTQDTFSSSNSASTKVHKSSSVKSIKEPKTKVNRKVKIFAIITAAIILLLISTIISSRQTPSVVGVWESVEDNIVITLNSDASKDSSNNVIEDNIILVLKKNHTGSISDLDTTMEFSWEDSKTSNMLTISSVINGQKETENLEYTLNGDSLVILGMTFNRVSK